jgi:hypothetical protein
VASVAPDHDLGAVVFVLELERAVVAAALGLDCGNYLSAVVADALLQSPEWKLAPLAHLLFLLVTLLGLMCNVLSGGRRLDRFESALVKGRLAI